MVGAVDREGDSVVDVVGDLTPHDDGCVTREAEVDAT
jgi:hypothetical protein